MGGNQGQTKGCEMKRQILIRPEAEADIEEAYRRYEEKLGDLGADFLGCLENANR